MKRKMTAPWFGAAYYPEDWLPELIDEDIQLMVKAGMNVMRVGEFAWSRMELDDGVFDFSWLHTVVDKLGAAGIAVIMGTPTATPPVWLTDKFPDMLLAGNNGRQAQHGARRHCCSNNLHYREYSARIVMKMAQDFGGKSGIIGWQIDNEIASFDRGCFCDECIARFRTRLERKYKHVGEMNRAWNLGLWSMEYKTFSQVPAPYGHTWHHPSLIAEWQEFQSDSNAEFVSMQAEILRNNGVKVPIGTDMMLVMNQNFTKTNKNLDVIQINHYNDGSSLWLVAFWMDYLRNLKARPFWNTETSTCWNGATVSEGYRDEGFCRVNTWLSYALGAEACLYWLWRSHWAGQELMHGSVISSCGRPLHVFTEVKEISKGLNAARDIITNTICKKSGLAIHFSHRASLTFESQPMTNTLQGWYGYEKAMCDNIYKPIIESQLRPDLIDPSASLEPYRVVVSTLLPNIDEGGLRGRILNWMEEGGIWVVGPLTDIRNNEGAKFTHAPYGCLESLAGIYCKYQLPANPREFNAVTQSGAGFAGSIWYDGFECMEGTECLAEYTDGPLKGLAAIAYRPVGSGGIMILGTLPKEDAFSRLILEICAKRSITPSAKADGNLLVIPREGEKGSVLFCIEYLNRPATIRLDRPMKDLLSGKLKSGEVNVDPFGVMILTEA